MLGGLGGIGPPYCLIGLGSELLLDCLFNGVAELVLL